MASEEFNIPEIGDEVYVPPADNRVGGLAVVSSVFKERTRCNVPIYYCKFDDIAAALNWTDFLADEQKRLKKQYGDSYAYMETLFGRHKNLVKRLRQVTNKIKTTKNVTKTKILALLKRYLPEGLSE